MAAAAQALWHSTLQRLKLGHAALGPGGTVGFDGFDRFDRGLTGLTGLTEGPDEHLTSFDEHLTSFDEF